MSGASACMIGFPALPASGIPWVRIVSCNPCELKDPQVPPVFSGYPAGDRTGWDEFRAEYERAHRDLWADFSRRLQAEAPPRPSPWRHLWQPGLAAVAATIVVSLVARSAPPPV